MFVGIVDWRYKMKDFIEALLFVFVLLAFVWMFQHGTEWEEEVRFENQITTGYRG